MPDLLNIRFTITNIDFLYGGKYLKAKICRFLTFSRHDGDVYLIEDDDV